MTSLRPQDLRALLDRAAASSDDLVALRREHGNGNGNGNGWPDPRPLDTPRPLPPLPIDRFPPVLADWISESATESQTPPELAAGIALATESTAALPLGPVHVRQGWQEELALFVLVMLPPSERKSAVLRRALEPLRDVQRQRRLDERESIAQRLADIAALEGRKSRLKSELGRASDSVDLATLRDELAEVEAQLAERPQPTEPRLLADDATPQRLAGLLAENPRLEVISAESALIDNLAGFYNEGRASLHTVCKAYGGEEVYIDRQGRTEYLERPLLALGFAVQPVVLEAMRTNRAMVGQGFAARFFYLLPESRLGHRQSPANTPVMTDLTASAYRRLVRAIADRADLLSPVTTATKGDKSARAGLLSPVVAGDSGDGLRLSTAALELLDERYARLEREFLPGGELSSDGAQAWGGKHLGRCIRIAGLFHLAHGRPPERQIDDQILDDAFAVGDAGIPHALRALGVAPEDEIRPLLEPVRQWIRNTGRPELRPRDLQRGPYVVRDSAQLCERVLARLEELGWARRLPDPAQSTGRPSSTLYDVRPCLASERIDG